MNKQISASELNKTEIVKDVVLNNEEYDPYVIVVLNQL